MNETITVTDPGWDWASTFAFTAPTVASIVLALIFMVLAYALRGRRRKQVLFGWMQGFFVAAGVTGLFLGLFGGGMYTQEKYFSAYNDQITIELSEKGYDNIKTEAGSKSPASSFTASKDGAYFEGKLVEDGTDTFIIVPLVGAK